MRTPIVATRPDPTSEALAWAICWQAALGRDFTFPSALPERIRARLIGAHASAGRALIDFVVAPTTIHAVVRIAEGDSVGSVAGAVGHVISRWVRAFQPVRGPVFADRYRAEQLTTADDLRHEIRMLAWRPVHLRLCVAPNHYVHGGLRTALGLTPSSGFDTRPVLQLFGWPPVPEARAALRHLIKRRPSEQEWREWELSRGLAVATGSVGLHTTMVANVARPAALLIAAGGGFEVDGALELLGAWVSAKISPGQHVDLQRESSPAAARGRALVACIAIKHRVCAASAVAKYFHRARATLSEQMSACRRRPTDRQLIDTPVRQILEEFASSGSSLLTHRLPR